MRFSSRRLAFTTLAVAGLMLSSISFAGSASAKTGGTPPKDPVCSFHSTRSMVEMGEFNTESSFAAVIGVSCEPIFSQQWVTVDASELNSACNNTLSGSQPPTKPGPPAPNAPVPSGQSQYSVQLDNDGNANLVLFGGPSCAPGTWHILASLSQPPFTTIVSTLTLFPPGHTPTGIKAAPASLVEDNVTSSIATVIQVEFPAVYAEKYVTIKSDELYTRCQNLLTWYGPDETLLGTGPEVGANNTVQLDNNGNAFVVAYGGPSCAAGTSTISVHLNSTPFTTYLTHFTVLQPSPRNP